MCVIFVLYEHIRIFPIMNDKYIHFYHFLSLRHLENLHYATFTNFLIIDLVYNYVYRSVDNSFIAIMLLL